MITGLAEPLFEKLTASPAEPFLKALQELYINFWGAPCLHPASEGPTFTLFLL